MEAKYILPSCSCPLALRKKVVVMSYGFWIAVLANVTAVLILLQVLED